MAFNLLELEEDKVGYGIEGLKIQIYGGNALGKTYQANKFPKPLLMCAESGGSAIKGKKVSINSKKDFLEYVKQLTDEKTLPKMKELYQTIIIDTIEDVIELFEIAICKEYGVKDVGEIQQLQKGNPNGYSVYRKEFKQQINLLTNKGYTVIFISHEETVEVESGEEDAKGNPIMVDYIQPKGSKGEKGSARFIRDLCDFRFYIRGNGMDKETGKPILSTACCIGTDKYFAGSRFAIQSFVNPYTADNLIEAIKKAQEESAKLENSGLRAYHIETKKDTREDYIEAIKPYFAKLKGLYPDLVKDIVDSQLGVDSKISEATDEQLTELETIYTNFISLACDKGIVVE